MRSKRTSLVPLFKLRDLVTKVKLQVDDTLDISGAAVILDGDPEVAYPAGRGYYPYCFLTTVDSSPGDHQF